ncbi:type I 3-dehydroquinate dehydratase [Salipaludibacillus sp. CF4.18]|uniref:type I 3-dehydroquinate dehydratase n=1 Tax=Salipaludibacillus sp. CF4.18 TaxID=3373081 RepID=UPI003EE4FFE7
MYEIENVLNSVTDVNKDREEPSICVPLVGRNVDEIISEVEFIQPKKPDMIEWRADFFENLNNSSKVIEVLSILKVKIPGTPILFTIRSEKEGGQKIVLSEKDKINLFEKVCTEGIAILDYEILNGEKNIKLVREITKRNGVKLMLSYHNFQETPDHKELVAKCMEAEFLEADKVKISVMSHHKKDVLLLLTATNDASNTVKIPLVTISMGEHGAITRIVGWAFGSTITFAIGAKSSAPGQMPIEKLRSVIQVIKDSI